MSALAQMLARQGLKVSGSDLHTSPITDELRGFGVRIHEGHAASNVNGAECVVFSSSISGTNPEVAEARRRNIPVLHRSEVLALVSAEKWSAAVSGSHGKSTTTGLLGWIYAQCGREPTVIVGARSRQLGGNFMAGNGSRVIFEADESDASFLRYRPDAIIVTNMDSDHLDTFGDMEGLYKNFRSFVDQLKPGGRWFGCGECSYTARLLKERPKGASSYGFDPRWDFSAQNVELRGEAGSRFDLWAKGERLGEARTRLFGKHNALNVTAAMALALSDGLEFSEVNAAVESYAGTARRFDILLQNENLIVVDDYAHHPTEIRRTLEAARGFSPRRLLVVFQPHRYSRTHHFYKAFAQSFEGVDELILTEVYGAGEKNGFDVCSKMIYEEMRSHGSRNVRVMDKKEIITYLMSKPDPQGIVTFVGAGDIGDVADEFANRFKNLATA